MLVFEKLGDACAKAACFNLSLNYYNKMLECADKLQKGNEEKAPIYFSIAETYFDLGNYNLAMENYIKEKECRKGNYREECKTWLNIAECQLKEGKSFDEINNSYQNSLTCAQQIKDTKLERSCLKSLINVQEKYNMTEEKISTELQLERVNQENDNLSESDVELSQQSRNSSLSDLSGLSDSSSDESQNEEFDRPRKPRGTSRLISKKNEKGETPLHRACISGNLNQVRRLIEKGHPVNPRDNCGWIPLHEAANHDHVEIVEYLLTKGAWVNDRGGIHCDGITPLHDAASCGNMEVMELLVNRGASVIAKTNSGDTPLDCLNKWRKRVGEDLDHDVHLQYLAMAKKIQEKINTAGATNIKSSKASSKPAEGLRHIEEIVSWESEDEDSGPLELIRTSRKRSISELSSEEESIEFSQERSTKRKTDSEPFVCGRIAEDNETECIQDDEMDVDEADIARKEYANAIDSVRSATWRLGQESTSVQIPTEQKRALVNEDEILIDDWLDEDVIIRETNRQPKTVCQNKHQTVNENKFRPRTRRKMKQLTLHSTKIPVDTSSVDDNLENEENYFCEVLEPQITSEPLMNHTKNSDIIRVKIRIQEKLFLVPITQNDLEQNVCWLAEAASVRYHRLFGLKPVLHLSTVDGAALAFDDKLTHVISGNEELVGNVDQWELPPLQNRYVAVCESLNLVPYTNIKHALEMADVSQNLEMINLGLKHNHTKPIFRALQCQYALKHLDLAGNCLGNDCLKMLANILTSLPNLSSLNLSCNKISSLGPLHDALSKNQSEKPLQLLTELNLNFNPLGDTNTSFLAGILSQLPLLSRLELSSCSLNKNFFNNLITTSLTDAKHLKYLNISYNKFDVNGIDSLLKCLNANQVTTLDFGSSGNYFSGSEKLARSLRSYLIKNNCALEELNLRDCYLLDEVIAQISPCLVNLSSLSHLCIANNVELSEASLIALTNCMLQNKQEKKLQIFDFSGCTKIISRLKTPTLRKVLDFWDRSEEKGAKYQLKLKWICR